MTIALIVLGCFGLVISVHELGHFLMGKLFGAKIDAFSIGFGKKLFKKKIGETEYCLSLIPFGGYVKFAEPDYPEDLFLYLESCNRAEIERYIVVKPVWQRFLVSVAGPVFNFLLAIIIASGMFYYVGTTTIATNIIGEVGNGSPAAKVGFRTGDRVIAINGIRVNDWADMTVLLKETGGKSQRFELSRNSKSIYVTVIPEFVKKENRYRVGFGRKIVVEEVKGLPAAFGMGLKETWRLTRLQVKALFYLATQKISLKNLGGPIMIFQTTAEAAEAGWASLLEWMFMFSVLLGFFNLLPIPVLDGGFLLPLAIEAIRGKPMSKKIQDRMRHVGLLMIAVLVVFATWNDLMRLIKL